MASDINIHEAVNYTALADHYIVRDGYIFVALGNPGIVFDAIVMRHPEDILCFSPRLPHSERSLNDHIALINELKLEKAMIIADDIGFIKACPSLKHLSIVPSGNIGNGFDYSPLYDMPQIKSLWCPTVYGKNEEFSTTIDYSKITGLECFSVAHNFNNCLNYQNIATVKTLGFSGYKEKDLQNAFSSLSSLISAM